MALNAGWDDELLKIELENLKELDFDLELTGFNIDELDDIFQAEEEQEIVEDDSDIEPPEEPRAKLGDIYQLGNHKLMCGSALNEEDIKTDVEKEYEEQENQESKDKENDIEESSLYTEHCCSNRM